MIIPWSPATIAKILVGSSGAVVRGAVERSHFHALDHHLATVGSEIDGLVRVTRLWQQQQQRQAQQQRQTQQQDRRTALCQDGGTVRCSIMFCGSTVGGVEGNVKIMYSACNTASAFGSQKSRTSSRCRAPYCMLAVRICEEKSGGYGPPMARLTLHQRYASLSEGASRLNIAMMEHVAATACSRCAGHSSRTIKTAIDFAFRRPGCTFVDNSDYDEVTSSALRTSCGKRHNASKNRNFWRGTLSFGLVWCT